MIDPRAHWKAPHQPRIVGLQQFRDRCDVLHSGIDPQIVAARFTLGENPLVREWNRGRENLSVH